MADLALLIGAGDVITLSGDLGAGKTAAARALIRFLANDENLEVPSPTFTLAQTYDLPSFPVLHTDLYRINDPDELAEIGLSPLPEEAMVLIEWPERARNLMPPNRIDIALQHRPSLGSAARAAEITGYGDSSAKITRLIALRRFSKSLRTHRFKRERMPGDASTRSYVKLLRNGQSCILMNSPPRPDGPALYDGKTYSEAVHLAENVKPFVAIANGLREHGYSAPAIHQADLMEEFLIIEDLGCESFFDGTPPAPIAERYQTAVDMLAAFHREPLPRHASCRTKYRLPDPNDSAAMMIEIGLMIDWYLPDKGVTLSGTAHAEFLLIWSELLVKAMTGHKTWVLRDFHSPNLIWLGRRKDTGRVGLIDFQDTVIGPAAYDLMSLLQDARVDVPESFEIAMLTRYVQDRRTADPAFDAATFAEHYAIMSAQRNTRLLGTFARLNQRDHKPHYLRHQPRAWTYLNRALAHPTLAALRKWCEAHIPPPEG